MISPPPAPTRQGLWPALQFLAFAVALRPSHPLPCLVPQVPGFTSVFNCEAESAQAGAVARGEGRGGAAGSASFSRLQIFAALLEIRLFRARSTCKVLK